MPKALICGVSGQDGAYLAELLLTKGYDVTGTSRDCQVLEFSNLVSLGIKNKVALESMSPKDFRSVLQVLSKVQPDEIYNLSGQSSVGLSFSQPMETMESISIGTLNLLEALRFLKLNCRLYNACSTECFGETNGEVANESTAFRPRSPYAVAKAAAFWAVANYRDAYRLQVCSGILSNHESPLRPERFVTRKIVVAACRIAAGKQDKLVLGDLGIERDWGWAPDYVRAMWSMLQTPHSEDYVISTGQTHSLETFVSLCFETLGLSYKKHLEIDRSLFRPSEIRTIRTDPSKVRERFGWEARYKLADVVREMVKEERKRLGPA